MKQLPQFNTVGGEIKELYVPPLTPFGFPNQEQTSTELVRGNRGLQRGLRLGKPELRIPSAIDRDDDIASSNRNKSKHS